MGKPDSNEGSPDRRRAVKTSTRAEVNQGILQLARDSLDAEQQWEFFCECGREDCHEYVSLTLDAYIALHDGGGAVLSSGHRRNQKQRARRLIEDAQTLRRAEHRVKRAKKKTGEPNRAA